MADDRRGVAHPLVHVVAVRDRGSAFGSRGRVVSLPVPRDGGELGILRDDDGHSAGLEIDDDALE